jgi:glutamate-1-semialdehyde 2,1-aminomutase
LTHGQPDSAGVPAALAALTTVLPFNDFAALENTFARIGHEIAAVILEPVPANAGLIPPLPGFLDRLREVTRQHGSVLIFDEVMTGFRVARGGVQELTGITPDLSCFGKVIGGGLPVGAFGGRADILDHLAPLGPVYQAGTLSGNPLALAAGLAQLAELDSSGGFARLESLGQRLEAGVRSLLRDFGRDFVFHRLGSMFCLFLTESPVIDLPSAMRSDKALFARFFHACLADGVYFAPSPYETSFLSTAHTEADIDRTLEVVERALHKSLR